MKGIIASGVVVLTLVAVTAYARNSGSATPQPAGSRGAFTAEILGDVAGSPRGEARFGAIAGEGRAYGFSISLGASSEEGSILFTRERGAPLKPGKYWISDQPVEPDEVRALVIAGSAVNPTGMFRGVMGTLVISSVTDSTILGSFQMEAAGFLAASPDIEGKRVHSSGTFIATRG